MKKKKSVGMIGFGNLGRMVADGISSKLAAEYGLTCIYDAYLSEPEKTAAAYNCSVHASLSGLLQAKPDLVIEVATVEALKQCAQAVIKNGSDMLVLSTGAFVDKEFYQLMQKSTQSTGRKIYIVSGAIGGLDLLQAAAFYGDLNCSITTVKPPAALPAAGAAANRQQKEVVFMGNVTEAIAAFPRNVNVAAAMTLASNQLDNALVKVISDPEAKSNSHTIEVESDLLTAKLEINATPSAHNQKSSALAAYSILAKLSNLASGICFC